MYPVLNPFLLATVGTFFSLSYSSPLSSSPAIAARAPGPVPDGTAVIDHPSRPISDHHFPHNGLVTDHDDPLPAGTGPKYLTEDAVSHNHARGIAYAPSGWAIVPPGVTVSVAPTYPTGTAIPYIATGTAVSCETGISDSYSYGTGIVRRPTPTATGTVVSHQTDISDSFYYGTAKAKKPTTATGTVVSYETNISDSVSYGTGVVKRPATTATGTAVSYETNISSASYATGTPEVKKPDPIGWPVPSGTPWPKEKATRRPLKEISIDADYCDDHPQDPCCDMDNENAPQCPDNGDDGSDTGSDTDQHKNGAATV